MSNGICFTGEEYEPDSYKEMVEDLQILEDRLKSLRQGKIPREDLIGYYLNLQFSDDGLYEHCPFCYIKRQGEVLTIRTRDEPAFTELREQLEREQHNIRYKGRWNRITKKGVRIDYPTILKWKEVPGSEAKDCDDPFYEITFSYNMAKPIVKMGVLTDISNHKEYMKEVQEEYDDYPHVEVAFKKMKNTMGDVMDALEVYGDADKCDMVIRALEEQAREVREWRDEEYNSKLDDYTKSREA